MSSAGAWSQLFPSNPLPMSISLVERRNAGSSRLASGSDDRDEAISGSRLRGRRQPDLLQAEQQHVAGRRQEDVRRPPRPNPSALRGLIAQVFRRKKNLFEPA